MDIKNLLDRYQQLDKRERYVLIGGGVFVALFILVVFILLPILGQRSALAKSIDAKDRQLKQVYELTAKINALERTNRASGGPQHGFTLFGYLEDLAKKQGVSERIEYMKPLGGGPREKESVEVRIKGLYEDELIGLMYGIDTCRTPLKIRRLNVRRIEKDKNLDATFQVQVNG